MVIDGGKMETVADFIFLGSKITVHRLQKYMNQKLPDLGWTVPAAMKLKDNSALRENYDQPRQHVKKQRHHFADKCPYCQNYSFSSSHVWRWELDHKESWALKNWCFWTMVLEKTLESPLDSKIKLVNPKGNQPWIFLGRIDAEAETPIFWSPDVKSWLIRKDRAGKDWGQEEKGVREDEMVGWNHHSMDMRLNNQETVRRGDCRAVVMGLHIVG